MFKSVLLASGMAVAVAGAASAADLPARVVPIIPVPLFSWTGAYLGANAGYAISERDTVITTGIGALQANVTSGLRPRAVALPHSGFTGGGQFGYNYQHTSGSLLVLGVEADAQYVDLQINRTENRTNRAINPNLITNTYRSEVGFLGTVRARLGFAFDRLLVFGTGGFAYGDVSNTVSFQTNAPVTYTGTRSRIETGYAYGGGIEYALPTDSVFNLFRSSAVTLKGEYLRYDLGSRNLLVASTGAPLSPGVGYNALIRNEGSVARGGINFKFGSY